MTFLSNARGDSAWALWLAAPYIGLIPAAVTSSQGRRASTIVLVGTLLTAGPMMLLTWAAAFARQGGDGQAGLGVGVILTFATLAQRAGVFIVALIARQSLPAENRPGTLKWLAAPLTILFVVLLLLLLAIIR